MTTRTTSYYYEAMVYVHVQGVASLEQDMQYPVLDQAVVLYSSASARAEISMINTSRRDDGWGSA